MLIVLGSQTRSLSFRDAKTVLRYGFYETGLEVAPPAPTPVIKRKPPVAPRRPGERRPRAGLPGAG